MWKINIDLITRGKENFVSKRKNAKAIEADEK